MKVPLLASSYLIGVDAVERCPLFAEKGWKLVRRTTDDSFANGDLMAGTMVAGMTHQQMKGPNFAMDFTLYDYNRIMFMTADCTKWVETTKDQFDAGWGVGGAINVVATSEGITDSVTVIDGVMTTSNFDAAEGCNIVYSEDATAPGCSTNEDGQSNSAEHQGYNVYIWTTGPLANPGEIPPTVAPLPYQTVEWEDVLEEVQCFDEGVPYETVRTRCNAYTGPDGTDSPGDWVPFSIRSREDQQTFAQTMAIPGRNGCGHGGRMWWGIMDDFDGTQDTPGQSCAAEGRWVDWWGNFVGNDADFVGWFNPGEPNNHGGAEDCAEGPADGPLNDLTCGSDVPFNCMKKWKGVDGPEGQDCTIGLPWDQCARNTCRAWGDPHVDGFDGNRNDVYGGAIYALSEVTSYARDELGLPDFKIAMETRQERHVAFIKKLFFTFPSNTGQATYHVTFTEHGDASISINGGGDLPLDPQDNSNFKFDKSGRRLEIETWLGVKASLQGVDAVINVPIFYSSDGADQDRIYGVCGNLNCQAADDWTLKDGTPCDNPGVEAGGYSRNQCEFDAANSFICNPDDPSVVIGDLNPPDDLPECTEDITARCDNLFNDPAFAQCLGVVEDENGNNKWIENCKADICIWPDVVEEQDKVLESVMANMVDECTQNRDPNEIDEQSLCNLPVTNTCEGENMQWKNCATCADRITCAEQMGLVTTTCDDAAGTKGMCICTGDFRLNEEGVCVHRDACTAPKVEFSPWSEWGACSVPCGGGGKATRTRICLGGSTCVGETTETRDGVCGNQPCPEVKQCADLDTNCEGFEQGFEDPVTGETQTIVMTVPIPTPDEIQALIDNGEDLADQPTPTITINGVETTDFNPFTQQFTFPDPVTGTNRVVTIDVNNQGIVFDDGQTFQRVDDDECDQASIDTCTNSLLHDQLICTDGAGLQTCNVNAEDIHTHNCKEYVSSTAAGWPDANAADAKAKCIEEGGRLMRMTTLQDVKYLSGAAGAEDADPFDMHAVCVEDSGVEGTWKSYDVAIDPNLFSASRTDGGESMDCAFVVAETGNDAATDRYRLIDYDCNDPRPYICERPRTAENTGTAWTYDQQDTCNHWIDCKDGRPTMVDQEVKLNADDTATQTYSSDTFSVTKSDGSTVIGQQQGQYITVPNGGLNNNDWSGEITLAASERCIQETLNEYCKRLGLLDDQTVPGEKAEYEDYNYARFSVEEDKWMCYKNILTGDAAASRSSTCVDNAGFIGGPNQDELCQAPNEDASEPAPVNDDVVDRTMKELIRHHVDYGCKRMDMIEFVAPKEVLVRCQPGCAPEYKYTRPSKCNHCEETGMTKEYGCAYFWDQAAMVPDMAQSIASLPSTSWDACTELCMNEPECESAIWDITAGENDGMCDLMRASTSTADKTCSIDNVIGGRKCATERECEPLVCDYCAEHGYTFNEGCWYSPGDDLDADSRHINVASYEACTTICTNTADCVAVTYLTKYYGSTTVESAMTSDLSADGSTGLGPMLCVLKKQTSGGLTCAASEHYQEIVSGEPCTTAIADDVAKFTGETVCNNLCDTCSIRNAAGVMDGMAKTKEFDCIHDGASIKVEASVTSFDECLAACDAHNAEPLSTSTCTHVRYTPSTSAAVDAGSASANDCELFENSLFETRQCTPDTVGQITARLCSEEPLCHVGCGDIDECGADALNDCANIAAAGGFADSFTCSNTIGSYTCDRGAVTLVPTAGEWSEDGTGGDGLTPWLDESGDEWVITQGTNAAGEDIVTVTGLDPAGAVEGTIVGNIITVPDPTNPENPRIGTISPDGKSIVWTQAGQTIASTGRTDLNECTADPANDPCASQAGTTCYNTDPGFHCNCNIGPDGTKQWTMPDGTVVQVEVNSAVTPKAAVSYTLADGTVTTGELLGSTVTFLNPDGSVKTGTITKDAATGDETISWDDGTQWSRVAGGNLTPADPVPAPADPVPAPADPVPAPADPVPAPVVTVPAPADPVPAPADPVPAPVVTVPVPAPATPPVGSQAPAASGVATGDPHFRIQFGQATDICFDMSGHDGAVFNLLHEPSSGLVINGQIVDSVHRAKHAHRLAKIGVISPKGAMVSFNTTAIETHTSEGITKFYNYDSSNDVIIVNDIDIQVNTREKFQHYGASFDVGGSSFHIAIKESKNSMKFAIENERHVTSDVEGLLGFTMAKSYELHDDGSLTINGERMRYRYDSGEDCYRLDGSDVVMKLSKHQMDQKYLLGRPFYVQLLAADTPK